MLTSVSMLFFLIYVLIIVFVAYLLITVLIFMKKKNRSDELLLQKIDELSKSLVGLMEEKRRYISFAKTCNRLKLEIGLNKEKILKRILSS